MKNFEPTTRRDGDKSPYDTDTAMSNLAEGKYNDGIRCMKSVVITKNNEEEVPTQLAKAYCKVGDHQKAMPLLENMLFMRTKNGCFAWPI